MNKGINLLGENKQVTLSPLLKKLQLLRIIAVGLLFIISSLSVILFLLILLSPLPGLQVKEKKALVDIASYHPDIAKLQLIDDRLKSTNIIIKKRNTFDAILTNVQALMPEDLRVTAITMKEKKLILTVTTPSLSSVETFIKNLVTAAEAKKDFSKVSLTNLVTDEQRKVFLLTVNLAIL